MLALISPPRAPLISVMRERSWLNLKMLQPSKLEAWWVGLWWWYSPRLVALQGRGRARGWTTARGAGDRKRGRHTGARQA